MKKKIGRCLRRSFALLLVFAVAAPHPAGASGRDQRLRREYDIDALEKAAAADPENYAKLSDLHDGYAHVLRDAEDARFGFFLRKKYRHRDRKLRERMEKIGPPADWDYYYDKAQLGISSAGVPAENFEAIDKAISLAPERPELYGLKENLLLIDKKWKEAAEASEISLNLAAAQHKAAPASTLRHHEKNISHLDCFGDETGAVRALAKIYSDYRSGVYEEHDCQIYLRQSCGEFIFGFLSRYAPRYQSSRDPAAVKFLEDLKADGDYQKFVSALPQETLDAREKAQNEACGELKAGRA